jgi:hypothetical protein
MLADWRGTYPAGALPLSEWPTIEEQSHSDRCIDCFITPLAVFLASDESAWNTGEVIRASGGSVVAT